jgi:hypothetical protein
MVVCRRAGARAPPTQPICPLKARQERPLPQVHGITQVGITVSDLTRSLDFYRGLLGFRVLGEFDRPQAGLSFTHLGRAGARCWSWSAGGMAWLRRQRRA